MIRKITYLFLLFLVFVNYSQAQQLPHYSLYMFNDIAINPAVCGTKSSDMVFLSHRSQWSGFDGAPKTQLLSYNRNQNKNMGLGAVLFNDVTGPVSMTGAQISYGYNVKMSYEYTLSFGLSANIFQYVFDGTKTQLHDDIYDPAAPGILEKTLVADATFGTYFYNDKLYIGLSVPNLIQSKINITTDNRLSRHYFIHSGYKFTLNNKFDFEPSLMFKATSSTPLQFDLNLRTIYDNKYWGGLSYRHKDAFVVMLGMDYKNYAFGYSFDFILSDINSHASGSHGITLGYKFRNKD